MIVADGKAGFEPEHLANLLPHVLLHETRGVSARERLSAPRSVRTRASIQERLPRVPAVTLASSRGTSPAWNDCATAVQSPARADLRRACGGAQRSAADPSAESHRLETRSRDPPLLSLRARVPPPFRFGPPGPQLMLVAGRPRARSIVGDRVHERRWPTAYAR